MSRLLFALFVAQCGLLAVAVYRLAQSPDPFHWALTAWAGALCAFVLAVTARGVLR
jgi:uncharacterized membrane protein YesL